MLLFRSGHVLVYKKLVYLYLVSDEESWRLFIDWNRKLAKHFCVNVNCRSRLIH